MNTQKTIFATVVAVVFLFAGYNLYSYFKEQQAIQQAEDRQAEARHVQKQQEREQRETDRQAKIAEAEERRENERQKQLAQKEQKQAEQDAKQQERLAEAKRKKEEQLQARILEARTPKHIEGLPEEAIEQLNSVSARYIRDHPDEFLNTKFSDTTFYSRRSGKRLLKDNTNSLMLYSAISQDTDILQALIDIGLNINSANKAGYTPLMFASAYNTPEVVTFLISKGADTKAKAYIQDLNALHIASLFNPKPDVINTLLDAGMDIEAKTENGYTPLLLAATDNRNLEVVDRLAELGADKGVYDGKGRTALKIIEGRISGEGNAYYRISGDLNIHVISVLYR
jgi:hypothetical protein